MLLRTIRISRNLFSLTERLPKNKYRGKSNDIQRNGSVDSTAMRLEATRKEMSNANTARKTIAANQIDMNLDITERLDSPKERSPDGDSIEMQSENAPLIGSQKRNRDIASKNKVVRKATQEEKPTLNVQRTPQADKVTKLNIVVGTRKLQPSPSVGSNNLLKDNEHDIFDDEGPRKPTIPENEGGDLVLPKLADKNSSIGKGKSSVAVVERPNLKLINENDSQNSNSQGDLLKQNKGVGLANYRAGSNPRVITKVRAEKGGV